MTKPDAFTKMVNKEMPVFLPLTARLYAAKLLRHHHARVVRMVKHIEALDSYCTDDGNLHDRIDRDDLLAALEKLKKGGK